MDADLKELKSVLRSLVVSSPSQVDVRTLLNDYRSMMGMMVPVAKYGYKNPVEFLKERCNDCFLFTGPPGNPILTLIVPDTLKHIDNFVKKQRVSVGAKIKGKRRSVPGSKSSPHNSNSIVNSFRKFQTAKEKTKSIKEPHIHTEEMPTHDIQENKNKMDKISEDMKKDTAVSDNVQEISDEIDGGSNCSSPAINSFLKKRLPLHNSALNLDTERHSNEQAFPKDDDSERQTSSSSSSAKIMKLERLKIEITDLIADHPDGIWCTNFIHLYREKYGKDVNFTWFGYTSILSLLYMLDDLVTVTRPVNNGDWLVCDARSCSRGPVREHIAAPPTRRATHRPAPPDPDDALPGINYDPEVFPEDCIHYMESLPSMSLQGLNLGMMLEVIVGEVYSPSHFWLIRLGDDYNIAMEDIMDEMTEYYDRGAGRERRLLCGAVRVGHYCASVYENDWHRSLIVQVLDADTVKVRHVDYGTVDTCATANLRPLLRRWTRLPAQALRARLADVRPCANSRQWPRPAAAHFLQVVRDARLIAYLAALDEDERALEVCLIDTSGEEDIYIGTELVRAGHADHAQHGEQAPRRSEWRLYPRFEALESGAAPSFAEVHRYLRDGIALQYVDAYRRHVPSCLSPCLPSSPSPSSSPPPPPPRSPAPDSSATPTHDSPATTSQQPEPTDPPSPGAAGPCLPATAASHLHSQLNIGTQSYLPTHTLTHQHQQQYPYEAQNSQPNLVGAESVPVVQLSVAECEMFRRLSLEDTALAHQFMLQAISCALAATNPAAQSTITSALLHPPQGPQQSQPPLRPPPGFEL